MGKNQGYKAMQRSRLGSSSAAPEEVEDSMMSTQEIAGNYYSPPPMDSPEAAGSQQPTHKGSSTPNSEMKAVVYRMWCDPHVFEVKEVPKPTVGDDEVMIEVAATGLNSNDALCHSGAGVLRLGQHGYNSYFGNECSGVVVAVGSKVSNFKQSDEVCAILRDGGGYAEFVLVPQSHVLQIPSRISLVAAAALPQASCLSFYALSILTKATRGKIILIHGAAGGVGIIALQYARHVGCKVFAVAGTEEKLRLCQTMGAEVCINHKKEDFRKRVRAETGDKGVDIILDVNGSVYFQKNLDCLAIGGSLVILGHKSGSFADINISDLGAKDISVVGADLINLSFEGLGSLLSDVAVVFWPLVDAGYIMPIIGNSFGFSQVTEAHRALDEYQFPGKLLLIPKNKIDS